VTEIASPSRTRWLLALLALTAVLFLVAASACGGDDNEDTNGDQATPTKEAGSTGGAHTGNATPTEKATNSGASGDAAEELKKLAGEYEQFEGYVKYSTSGFGSDSASSIALYQKGGSSRLDIESPDGNIIIINTPDATYMCTVAENQCIKYPAGQDTGLADAFTSLLDPSTIEDTFDLPDDVDIDTSSDKIAGIDAVCFSASGDLDPETPGDESGEVCFSENGLLLRLKFESGGESGSFEATEASGDVPSDAFEPPYDVIDLGDLGQ